MQAIVFDFDSTLSSPIYLESLGLWAITDKPKIISDLSDEQRIANFGGKQRLAALDAMLRQLSQRFHLFIISIGYKRAIMPLLDSVSLSRHFCSKNIFGQDSPQLQQVNFVKAALINNIMKAYGWKPHHLLFVRSCLLHHPFFQACISIAQIDDSAMHIDEARRRSTCQTFKVENNGLSLDEMRIILQICSFH